MDWNELTGRIDTLECAGASAALRGVEYDSRKVSRGSVFVAMRGGATDGNRFVDAAVQQGAGGVLTDSRDIFERVRREQPQLGVALVEHGRRALAQASAAAFGDPQRRLALSAVTGTNGKTTTAFLLEQMLRSVSRECLLIGTVEYHVGPEVRPSVHTTPESRDILELFADAAKMGCSEAVMEMSSHALEQERVWGLPVDVAIFTNLTQDHLDYHGTMEEYAAAKARIFRGVGAAPPRVAVINADDAYASEMMEAASRCQVLRYGMKDEAEFRAMQVRMSAGRTEFQMRTPTGEIAVTSPLTGSVNVYNLLAASAAAWARGMTLEQIVTAARQLQQVPGRFELVPARTSQIAVVVDYAHTDDALRNLTALARDLVKEHGGRVITLFGCGGDRDRSKRPRMGRAAGEGSDLVILTSDNPRSEDPIAIINEAVVGLRETGARFLVEEDRGRAIEMAIGEARTGDIVLLAGKGHEKTQTLRDRTIPFDDAAVAAAVLEERR